MCFCAVDTLTGFLALDWWHIWIGLIQEPVSSHTLSLSHVPHTVFCSSPTDSFGWAISVCNGVPCSMMTMGIKHKFFFKRISSLFLLLKKESFLISSSRIHHHPSLLSSTANYTADHLLQGYKCSNTSISEQSWVADRCTNFNSVLVCVFFTLINLCIILSSLPLSRDNLGCHGGGEEVLQLSLQHVFQRFR